MRTSIGMKSIVKKNVDQHKAHCYGEYRLIISPLLRILNETSCAISEVVISK